MQCTQCKATLMRNARFCHQCGAKAPSKAEDCPSCGTTSPAGVKFCGRCGCALAANTDFSAGKYATVYSLDFENTGQLSEQIEGHFFGAMKRCVSEEQDPKRYKDYVATFYSSNFDQRFKVRAQQLAEEAYTIHCRQDDSVWPEIDQFLEGNFNDLLDYFMVMHCRELNRFAIPERILKYQGKSRSEIVLVDMVHDYLDLEGEPSEKFYLDFLSVPENKIRTAARSFLFADKKECVYLLADQTVFGSCKEGFAITERGLYWKAHFNKSCCVFYDNLQNVKREKNWIIINGRFFNVNPQFNFKMMKLLKKLKELY